MDEEARADSSGATVTVRLIRSFEYRSIKYVVFKDVSLEQTAKDFMDFVVSGKSLSSKTSDRAGINEGLAKFPNSPILHYASIYGALLFSVTPIRCACITRYVAVRKFFQALSLEYTRICRNYEFKKNLKL